MALMYADRADDTDLIANLDLMLKVVESRINRVLNLQDLELKTTLPGVVGQTEYTLPTKWLSLRSIRVRSSTATSGRSLVPASIETINNAYTNGADGCFYAIVGKKLLVYPTLAATEVIEIDFLNRVEPLTAAAPDNPISINNPDCYVFGLESEIMAYAKNPDGFTLWDTRFKEALKEITIQNDIATWSGTAGEMRLG